MASLPIDIASQPLVVFGFGTDIHEANRAHDGIFYYQDAVAKMAQAMNIWRQYSLSFVIFNGDFIDGQAGASTSLSTIEAQYSQVPIPRYYTFGNHEFDGLSKTQFITGTGMVHGPAYPAGYYSFDVNNVHFIVLDACFNTNNDSDPYDNNNYDWQVAWIPPNEITWLTSDLAGTSNPVVVFAHQRLDGGTTTNPDMPVGVYTVKNASTVRGILEASGKVIAVLQGHAHCNEVTTINGIVYYEMAAMLDNPYPADAYSIVRVYRDRVRIGGFASQTSY